MAARERKPAKSKDLHPDEELAALLARVRAGLPPLVVLRGDEPWYRGRALRAVLEAANARGDEVCRHDTTDPDFSLAALLDDLTGGALFATTRCVVVAGADGLVKKGGAKHSPALLTAIKARLASSSPGTVVVVADDLRADHALVKAAEKGGGVACKLRRLWDSPPPWDPDPRRTELARWVMDRAREQRIALSPEDAVYLAAATGNDLSALEDRLKELRGADPRDLRASVAWEAGASPWDVAERMVDGDVRDAVRGLETLFHGGFQGRGGPRTLDRAALVTMLCSALTARLREAASGADAFAAGLAPAQAAAEAGVKGGPRAVATFQARLGKREPARWRTMIDDAAAVERRARSGADVDAADFATLALAWSRRG